MRSLLDGESKGWPWNSGHMIGAGAAIAVTYWWGFNVANLIWLAVNAVWLTVAGLRYRNQRKART